VFEKLKAREDDAAEKKILMIIQREKDGRSGAVSVTSWGTEMA